MSRIGYGRTRLELASTVKKILTVVLIRSRTTGLENNGSGFFKRNPELSLRTTIQIGKKRALVTRENVMKRFTDFRNYIEVEVGDSDLLKDPSRIYNTDENGFALCTKGNREIGCRGAPVVYHFANSDKSQLTVMAAVSATAHYIPPIIFYPCQRFTYTPSKDSKMQHLEDLKTAGLTPSYLRRGCRTYLYPRLMKGK
ncbi:hypothetical protein DPMN_143519 [Dreissena polymorpha]|uniref:Uncharacterized protein n=1 Tax=Dreissena polymorpha TaxID=45954 RepID=A0A9D4JK42_DREPO|nr:hypothetical protein DPMN_143519 [Dreissena polymorpha]